MKAIWKFSLDLQEYSEIEMPQGATVLTVQVQHGTIRLWAIVDTEAPKQPRMFQVCGTGASMLENVERSYIGTVQLQGGRYIFHIFEILGDWRYMAGIKPI